MQKVYGVALAAVAVVSLAVAARSVVPQQPGDTTSPATTTAVQVVNFPVDAAGDLRVKSTHTVLLDLLDTATWNDGSYSSDEFEVDAFNRVGVKIYAQAGWAQWRCNFEWTFFEGDGHTAYPTGVEFLVTGSAVFWSDVYGSRARVHCSCFDSCAPPNPITDVKVLLRRE